MLNFVAAADQNGSGVVDSATVAIIVAVIALVGVLAAQTITLFNERARRRDEKTKLVRDEIQKLMMDYYAFWQFASETWPGKRPEGWCEPYEKQWASVSAGFPAVAAQMAGRGKHRSILLDLQVGLTVQPAAYNMGESIGDHPRSGYLEMAWAAFETVAAWLRTERAPRSAKRAARKARKMRSAVDAEYRWRDHNESGEKTKKRGLLRRWARGISTATKVSVRWIGIPFVAFGSYLFRP